MILAYLMHVHLFWNCLPLVLLNTWLQFCHSVVIFSSKFLEYMDVKASYFSALSMWDNTVCFRLLRCHAVSNSDSDVAHLDGRSNQIHIIQTMSTFYCFWFFTLGHETLWLLCFLAADINIWMSGAHTNTLQTQSNLCDVHSTHV